MAKSFLKIYNGTYYKPLTTPPTDPQHGDVYFNNSGGMYQHKIIDSSAYLESVPMSASFLQNGDTGIKAAAYIQDILYTAKNTGISGNLINIIY